MQPESERGQWRRLRGTASVWSDATYLTTLMLDGDGGADRWRRGVVMLSVTLGCVTRAGWMPLSTASCLNEETYGCTRASAHLMNIWFIFPVCMGKKNRERERERRKKEGKIGRIFLSISHLSFQKKLTRLTLWHSNHNCQSWIQISQRQTCRVKLKWQNEAHITV